jgi:copper(I)-binding protein
MTMALLRLGEYIMNSLERSLFKRRHMAILAAMAIAMPAVAQTKSPISITKPWLRETAVGQSAGGGFFTVTNAAPSEDRLTGGSSPIATRVEIHSMSMDGGVMRMRPVVGGLAVPAGKTVELKPGGLHVMLTGLKRPLKRGERVPVTLHFAKAGKVPVQFSIQPITFRGDNP